MLIGLLRSSDYAYQMELSKAFEKGYDPIDIERTHSGPVVCGELILVLTG